MRGASRRAAVRVVGAVSTVVSRPNTAVRNASPAARVRAIVDAMEGTAATGPWWARPARALAIAGAVALSALTVPRCAAGRDARAWFDGDLATEDALARRVARAVVERKDPIVYHLGNDRFDGQSAVAIYQMTLLGLGQILIEHPEKKDDYLPAMRIAAERLASPELLVYARHVYGHHGVERMGAGEGHAYLGYINFGLGMLRRADPETRLAPLHDRITAELARRLDASPTGMIETYPEETWPPDVAAVAGSIGLHASVTGEGRGALLARWARRFETCAIDRAGMLVQRVESGSCDPRDAPRGSGTAVASYFVAFAAPDLARRLYGGVSSARRSIAGFGAVREYEEGYSGRGDLNAGPIVFGLSVGATGFGLGAARIARDRDAFVELYRSAHLVGAEASEGGGTAFAAGGLLGDALLLAMLTARVP